MDSRTMIKIKMLFFCLAGLLLNITNASALEVIVVGQDLTRQAAINQAIRSAVEQAAGSYVHSETRITNSRLDFDKIISESAGYIRHYDILAEGKDPIDNSFKVRLRVEVNEHKLHSFLNDFLQDTRSQKAFQETSFDQRRIIVLYKRRTTHDLHHSSKGVQTLIDLVQDRLKGYGFRVFLRDELIRIKKRVSDLMLDEETAITLARQEDADAVVLINIDAGSRKTSDGYNIVSSGIALNAYDATTGELFANVQDEGQTVARIGTYFFEEGVSRVAAKLGEAASEELIKKIVKRFSGNRFKFVVLIVRDVQAHMQNQVEKLITDLGWKYRISRQTGTFMELELFSESDPTSVKKIFRRALKKNDIHLYPVEFKGSRIVYSGE
ncbi:Flagellar assembly protein T N-terminal domain-containing protein [Candidatus Magnetomoraceae bacterium gMMP-15]